MLDTRHCHSLRLRLHLHKYGHKPAMVLNADSIPIEELSTRAVNDSGLESAPEYVLEYVLGLG